MVIEVPLVLVEGPRGVRFQRSDQAAVGAVTRCSSSPSSLGRGRRMWDSPFLSELLCGQIIVRPAPAIVVSVTC